jgi:hypothetical protein
MRTPPLCIVPLSNQRGFFGDGGFNFQAGNDKICIYPALQLIWWDMADSIDYALSLAADSKGS